MHGLPKMILKVERKSSVIELKSIQVLETTQDIKPIEIIKKTYTINEYQDLMNKQFEQINAKPNLIIVR